MLDNPEACTLGTEIHLTTGETVKTAALVRRGFVDIVVEARRNSDPESPYDINDVLIRRHLIQRIDLRDT